MKSSLIVLVAVLCMSATAIGQFKSQAEQPSAAQSLVRPSPTISSFLGLLNMDNFTMRHNFSVGYISSGGDGLSLASYTNSMFYKISDPLNVRFDLTLQGSPFGQNVSPYHSALNGLFLSRAELNYRPWENFFIKVEYQRRPGTFYGLYNPWYNPYSSSNFWGDE
ncbi:MAG: hypothetical protein HYR76_06500 [Ignavibacteria bacterium]|nr:hypothetical protein [Ignavibacteria bacterium]